MKPSELFLAALELATEQEQDAFVDSQTEHDLVLRADVQSLLKAHREANDFLQEDQSKTKRVVETVAEATENLVRSASDSANAIQRIRELLGPHPDPKVITSINQYRLLEVLGAGGFGLVFHAWDETLERDVAIKMLVSALEPTSDLSRQFLREARSAAAVNHENVVRIHEVKDLPIPYIVMEFIDGPTLQAYLDKVGPLEIPVLIDVSRQIASGLAAAHDRGFVHRDIKPSNILVQTEGELKVKLTDFGLAHPVGDVNLSGSGQFLGTPLYASPEQAKCGEIDARSDLFSLGSVMYQLATGRPPFKADSTQGVLQRVLQDTPRPIKQIRPNVPDRVCQIIEQLHAKNPELRIQSASQLAKLLSECSREIENAAWIVGQQSGLAIPTSLAGPSTTESQSDLSLNVGSLQSFEAESKESHSRSLSLVALVGLLVTLFAMWFVFVKPKDEADSQANSASDVSSALSEECAADAPKHSEGVEVTLPMLPLWSLPEGAPEPLVIPTSADKAKQLQTEWANYLQQAPITATSIGLAFALVPPGEFDKTFTRNRDGDIHPSMPTIRYRITEPYRMSTTEVTVAQFRTFVEETGYVTDAEKLGFACSHTGYLEKNVDWRKVGRQMRETEPVTMVTEADAAVFCGWLSKKEGRRFRLPTESQWIHACRAGSSSRFVYGADAACLEFAAWTAENSGVVPNPVGVLTANPLGLHDMLGNLWERTSDWLEHHAALPYLQQINPQGVPISNTLGGCFVEPRTSVQTDVIVGNWSTPSASIGFRVAEVIGEKQPTNWLASSNLVSEGSALSAAALTTRPAKVDGLRSWSLCLAGIQSAMTTSPAWNSSTKQWFVGGNEGCVTVLDEKGRFAEKLFGPCNTSEVKVSNDGKWVAVKDSNGSMVEHLYVWYWPDRKLKVVLPIDSKFWSISPDSTKIVFTKQNRGPWNNWGAYELDLASGLVHSLMTPRMIDVFAWTSRSDRIVCQTRIDQEASLEVIEYPSMKSLCAIPSHRMLEIAVSPDGKKLAIPDAAGDKIRIRDLDSLQETRAIGFAADGVKPTCQWFNDSDRLLITGTKSHSVVRASTGVEVLGLQTADALCHPPKLCDEAGVIVVAELREPIVTVESNTGQSVGKWATNNVGSDSASIVSEQSVFVASGNQVRSFDLSRGDKKEDRQWYPKPWGIDSQNATLAAIKDGQLVQFNLKSGSPRLTPVDWLGNVASQSIECSKDGKKLACLVREEGDKNKIYIINATDGERVCELSSGEASIAALEWLTDDKQIAGLLLSGTGGSLELNVWDVANGQLLFASTMPAHLPVIQIVDEQFRYYQKDHCFLLALSNSLFRFEVDSRTWKATPACKLPTVERAIWQSPDHSLRVLSYGSRFHQIHDADSNQFKGEIQFPRSNVMWSADGATMMFHQPDFALMNFDAKSLKHIGALVPFIRDNHWLVCSPDGHYRGSNGVDSMVVYVAMHEDGSQRTYTPAEFSSQFNWKNSPDSVALILSR